MKIISNSTRNKQKTQKSADKRISRKCRVLETGIEQNNDRTRIMREIQLRSSFKIFSIFTGKHFVGVSF